MHHQTVGDHRRRASHPQIPTREIDHIIVDTASRSQCTTQTVIPAAASDGDHSIIQVDYTTTDPNPTKTGGGRPASIPLSEWDDAVEWAAYHKQLDSNPISTGIDPNTAAAEIMTLQVLMTTIATQK